MFVTYGESFKKNAFPERYCEPFDLLNSIQKHVIITGGSSGLGKETARLLLEKGASVTIVARREAVLEEAKRELQHSIVKGASIHTVSADVTDPKSSERMLQESERRQNSPVDCVICCAGASHPGFFTDQDPEIFRKEMELNYLGAVNTILVGLFGVSTLTISLLSRK